MKYVFEGEDLSNVLRENEIRIKRGTLKVYPLEEETAETPVDDTKEVEAPQDTKAVSMTDEKKPKKITKK